MEFVSISRVINHMTCYNFECSHWWKIYLKNPLQDLLSSLNAVISTNESTQFITGHVIYNLAYTYKFQLKTTQVTKNITGQDGNLHVMYLMYLDSYPMKMTINVLQVK